jgi:hypothetical protein
VSLAAGAPGLPKMAELAKGVYDRAEFQQRGWPAGICGLLASLILVVLSAADGYLLGGLGGSNM